MLFFDCLGETRKKPEGSELEVNPMTLDYQACNSAVWTSVLIYQVQMFLQFTH